MNHPVQPSPGHTTGRARGTLPSPKNYISEERTIELEKLYGNCLL